MLEVPNGGSESSSRYEYVGLPNKNICAKFWLPTLCFKMQRTLMSLLSWLGLWGLLEVPNLGFGSLSGFKYVQLPQKNLGTKYQLPYWVLECKELSCPNCLDWGCRGCWRFLIRDWSLHQGINMFGYPRRTSLLNFSFLHWISRCKELSCHYSPDWVLEVAGSSWLGFWIFIEV